MPIGSNAVVLLLTRVASCYLQCAQLSFLALATALQHQTAAAEIRLKSAYAQLVLDKFQCNRS